MRRSTPALLLALGVFIQAVGVQAANSQDCITTLDPNKDYFDSKVKNDTASYFSVQYKKYYKIVTNTKENEVYVLYQCGATQPVDDSVPAGTKYFSVPVKKVGILSTTVIPYLEMLGARSTIKAVSNPSYVTSPCIENGIKNNQIEDLASGNATLYAEQVANLDIVFGDYQKSNDTKVLISSETADPGPLNRAEWLEFYSTFFNLEDVANNLTSTINANYGCYKANAQSAQFQGSDKRPVVAWTTMNTWGDNPTPFEVSNAAYKKALTTDAGGTFFEPSVLKYANAAAFKAAVASVDVLIDDTYEASSWDDVLTAYGLTATDNLPFVKNKAIYRYDRVKSAAGGFDFLEAGVPMADAVLEDMIWAILGTKFNYKPGDEMNWFRNIGNKEVIITTSASTCPSDVFAAKLKDVAFQCLPQTLTTAAAGSDAFGTAVPNVKFTVLTAFVSSFLRFVL